MENGSSSGCRMNGIHYLPFQRAPVKTDPLTFHLKPFQFRHTGLFPERAVNWDWFSGSVHETGGPVKVLNLFAYRRCASIRRSCGSCCDPCGCVQGYGRWAKRMLLPDRTGRCSSGPFGGRLRMKFVEREDPPWQQMRRHHHGSPFLAEVPRGEIWKMKIISGISWERPHSFYPMMRYSS